MTEIKLPPVPKWIECYTIPNDDLDHSQDNMILADRMRDYARAAIEADRQARGEPVGRQHPDDAAVDAFATAMKGKLAKKRAEGRGGWQSCDAAYLSDLLREHVEKGDPVDVANLAMMLHQNGQSIQPQGLSASLRSDIRELAAYAEGSKSPRMARASRAVFAWLRGAQTDEPVAEVPEGWREQFKEAVYDNLAAADNQDVPLEEYPDRILGVLNSIVGPRHPTVVLWRNDAIKTCMSIAYKYCRDPETYGYLKQDFEALITEAPQPQQQAGEPVSVPSSTEILTIWAQTNEDCPLTHCEATRITRFVDALLAKHGQNTACCNSPSQCWEPCGELGNSLEHARVAETAKDYQKSDALNTQPSATDRKEIMSPALDRADLAFIYDELRQSGKGRAAELVRAAILAKHGQPTLPYNLDTDPAKIRALAADAIRGAIGFGIQGANPPPPGHWLTEFWEAGMHSRNGDKES